MVCRGTGFAQYVHVGCTGAVEQARRTARMEDAMNRQRRLQLIAMAQRVTEVNRLAAEYERELLRERQGSARGAEAPCVRRPRQRRHR